MDFLRTRPVSKNFLLINVLLSVVYFGFLAFVFPFGNSYVFGLLILASIFSLWQVVGYVHSVWPRKRNLAFDSSYTPPVGIYITVTGEPDDVVAKTVEAALRIEYPNFKVYILNDGYVANKENWREAEDIADKYEITCITRKVPGGAKAGNINNALKLTPEPFIVIFDADHVPKPHFLKKMMGYMVDDRMAFVQSPQYYKNHDQNLVTGGSWEQQALFFGAICKGKDATNTTFMCGTNMLLRKEAIIEAGGMSEESIAEDFLTSLLVHEKGWKSVYVDEVLAEGLAPEDFLSYYKQQFRWARGSLEVVFKYNPIFRRGLTLAQKIQYLSSSSYYLSGLAVTIYAGLPLLFFYTGLEPLIINSMTLALIFIPYLFVVLYTIQLTSNFSYTFRALSFSLSSFPIHLQAVWQIIRRKKSGFVVTSKKKVTGNHGYLVTPHYVYIGLVLLGITVAFLRDGLTAALLTNTTWAFIYIAIFAPFIAAATENVSEEAPDEQLAGTRAIKKDRVKV
jgi:cellulose synthase (UDP-forming)